MIQQKINLEKQEMTVLDHHNIGENGIKSQEDRIHMTERGRVIFL